MTKEQLDRLTQDAALSEREAYICGQLAANGRDKLRKEFMAAGKSPRTLDSHVKNIRRKLADARVSPALVDAIFGAALSDPRLRQE